MKRLFSALTGLVLLASASGCCCDCCNWCRPTCCNDCSPCGAPATAYMQPAVTTALPATYGTPVATAAITPYESLPTY